MPRKQRHLKHWSFILRVNDGTHHAGDAIATSDPARLEGLHLIAQEVDRKTYKRARYGQKAAAQPQEA